jgi:phosphohistidine phosphatase SixA
MLSSEIGRVYSADVRLVGVTRPTIVMWLALGACSNGTPPAPDAPADAVVHVVRHAETGSTATDPPLDATGQARAQSLATLLAPANVTAAFTSQFRRTQETAMPTALAGGFDITVVDVAGANYGTVLANAVRDSMATSVLIVGHSDTVPDTVKALSGEDVPPISETEFDRIYTITLSDPPVLVEDTY